MRKKGRELEDADGALAARMGILPSQETRLDLQEMEAALQQLPAEQREAVLLVGASGFSYEEAASVCSVPVGTIKSRVCRARTRLAELLEITGVAERSDRVHLAAVSPATGSSYRPD